MTLEEAAKQYDISMSYAVQLQGSTCLWGWTWSVECGYQAFDGRIVYPTAGECEKGLIEFLKSFTGPTK